MGEVGESAVGSFDPFDEQVHGFGRAVGVAGAVPVDDLSLPAGERRGQRPQTR